MRRLLYDPPAAERYPLAGLQYPSCNKQVRPDDPDHSAPTRADLEARLRALEEKRDRLLERIAAQRLDVAPSAQSSSEAAPAAVLEVLEKTLTTVQPMLGMMTSAGEMLLAERAKAELRNDAAGADISRLLDDLSAQIDEFRTAIAQLNAAADMVRASMNTDVPNASEAE